MSGQEAAAGSRRSFHHAWAITLLLVLAFGAGAVWMQHRAGAFRADYAGYPDEPSHYLNGLLIRDYIAAHAPSKPFTYAVDYYAHYPKVTFGHWPPLFHCLEAAWMLLFSASRTSVMLMMAVQMAALATLVALAARRATAWPVGIAAGAALLLLPISSQQMSMVMTETLLGFCCLAAVLAWARYLAAPSWRWNVYFGLLASAAILVKGDALALALVPPLTVLATGNLKLLGRRHFWPAIAIVFVLCGPFYIWTSPISSLGWAEPRPTLAYVLRTIPEIGRTLTRELGVPLLVLAAAGLSACLALPAKRRTPLVLSLLFFFAGGLLFQAVIPAGMEDRKLYYLLPACLILTAAGVYSLVARWRPALSPRAVGTAAGALLLACAAFHFQVVSRYDRGFRDVAQLVVKEAHGQPAVILVSSNYQGEGLLVASVAEAHPQPALYVIRANELLADAGWAEPAYRPQVNSVEQLSEELATIQPAFLVLHDISGRIVYSHEKLLRELVTQSPERYPNLYSRTIRTDLGQESLDVYRGYPIDGTRPSLDRVYHHLQKTLSRFLDMK